MRRLRLFALMCLGMVLCSGCSTMSESFSCNQTAWDNCLSMDEVHAMTEEKGAYQRKQAFKSPVHAHESQEQLWVAQSDEGEHHA